MMQDLVLQTYNNWQLFLLFCSTFYFSFEVCANKTGESIYNIQHQEDNTQPTQSDKWGKVSHLVSENKILGLSTPQSQECVVVYGGDCP